MDEAGYLYAGHKRDACGSEGGKISSEYASHVSGKVRAVIGKDLRPGNIWENVELPALKANPNVTEISTIDPKTLKGTTIFTRPK